MKIVKPIPTTLLFCLLLNMRVFAWPLFEKTTQHVLSKRLSRVRRACTSSDVIAPLCSGPAHG